MLIFLFHRLVLVVASLLLVGMFSSHVTLGAVSTSSVLYYAGTLSSPLPVAIGISLLIFLEGGIYPWPCYIYDGLRSSPPNFDNDFLSPCLTSFQFRTSSIFSNDKNRFFFCIFTHGEFPLCLFLLDCSSSLLVCPSPLSLLLYLIDPDHVASLCCEVTSGASVLQRLTGSEVRHSV